MKTLSSLSFGILSGISLLMGWWENEPVPIDLPTVEPEVESAPACMCDPVSDSLALVALYNSTNGTGWTNNTNWLVPGQSISSWYGVNVGGDGCVQEIFLASNQLTGNIPSELGNLSSVVDLLFEDNQLNGNIPPELSNLISLEFLTLRGNQLDGNIPPSLGNLTSLLRFDISYNQLTGNIPPELGNLNALVDFYLEGNQISGSIPVELGNLSNLEYLFLFSNQLIGSIPAELGNLSLLQFLYLNDNNLEGCIPEELQALCANVIGADISNNPNLATQSWSDFCSLQSGMCCTHPDKAALVALYESTDGENWTTSWDTTNCDVCNWYGITCDGNDRVICLDLDDTPNCSGSSGGNNLTGTLPSLDLPFLEELYLGHNNLSGSIPSSFPSGISHLLLNHNNLSGTIPSSMGNYSNLVHLNFNINNLTGSIPSSLGNLSNLQILGLGGNSLDGSIPSSLGNLSQLITLSLYDNQLTGSIPSSIQNLSNLNVFSAPDNQLSGSIPPELGALSQLGLLHLYNNQLSGTIPSELGNLSSLNDILLNNNNLEGCIPESLQNLCPNVWQGNISNNPNLATQSWSDFCNLQSGMCCTHPDKAALVALYEATDGDNWTTSWDTTNCDVCNWYGIQCDGNGRVICLDLDGNVNCTYAGSVLGDGNNLVGTIPSQISELTELQYLDLSDNQLNGSIPSSISNLTNLQYLLLSYNQLSGSIPTSFGSFNSIIAIQIVSNQLSGTIPTEIGNASSLEDLLFTNNQLSGNIPSSIGNLANLHVLYLSQNDLDGSLPVELGNLNNLTQLFLSSNQLSGNIPTELGSMGSLQWVKLTGNNLSGNIPPEIGDISSLSKLELSFNQLDGPIPSNLGNLSNLEWLFLNNNDLSGCIPEELQSLCPGVTNSNISNNPNLATQSWSDFCNLGTGSCGCPPSGTTTIEVINTNSSGYGSLAEAVSCANADPTLDNIHFNIPGTGPHTIAITGQVGITDDNVIIDGSTQSGGIIIDASALGSTTAGIGVSASGVQVLGLEITGTNNYSIHIWGTNCTVGDVGKGNKLYASQGGILCVGADNIAIQYNEIGVTSGISSWAMTISGDNMVIQQNVIGVSNGVALNGANNQFSNNYIGTDNTGTAVYNLNTGADGVWVYGTQTSISGNIFANARDGVRIISGGDASITNNTIRDNAGNAVQVDAGGGSTTISQNSIYCNNGEGIYYEAVISNPFINTATTDEISGVASPNSTIELFSHDETGCSGVPCQGKTFIGQTVSDGTGNWIFISPPVSVGTEVTVTETEGSGSTSEFSFCLTVSAPCPTLSATLMSNSPICQGEQATLTFEFFGGTPPYDVSYFDDAPIINGYFESGVSSPFSLQVSPSETTTYQIEGIWDADGCFQDLVPNNITTTVTVNDPPVIETVDDVVCEGDNIQLSVTAPTGVGFSWSGPNGFSSTEQNPVIPNASLLNDGVYTVTVTDVNDCSAWATSVITVLPAPNAIAGSNSPVCVGQNLNLTESGGDGTSWSWSGPNSFSSGLQDPNILSVTTAASGLYTVTVTDGNMCTNTSTVSVTIDEAPAVPGAISGPITTCDGNTETYFIAPISGATSYVWTLPIGANFVGQDNGESITVDWTGASSGDICVAAENGCGISSTSCITVQMEMVPSQPVFITGEGAPCENTISSYGLQAVAGVTTFNWTLPPGASFVGPNNSFTVDIDWTGASDGDLCVSYENPCGTSPQECFFITVIPDLQPPGAISGNSIVCNGANQIYSIPVEPNALGYEWTLPVGVTPIGSTNSEEITVSFSGNVNGDICVATLNDCGYSFPPTCLTVSTAPPLVATADSNSPVCEGLPLSLFETGGAGVQWSWTGPNSFTSPLQNPVISSTSTLASGTYTVTVTDGNGCTNTASTVVTVNASPTVNASSNSPLCEGEDLNLIGVGGAGLNWEWNGPNSFSSFDQSPTISSVISANAGTYTVTVTDGNGCSNTASTLVEVNASASISASNNGPVCEGESLQLFGSGGSGTWEWSGPNSFSASGQNQTLPSAILANAGTYSVTLTTANGCTSTASTLVEVNENVSVTSIQPTPVSCFGFSDGSIQMNISGGSGHAFNWSPAIATGQNPSGLPAGIYNVTVTSSDGCSATTSTEVTEPMQLTLGCGQQSPTTSPGGNDGIGFIVILGGTAPYDYVWSGPISGMASATSEGTEAINGLEEGSYGVTLTDANGCEATCSFTINGPDCAGFVLESIVPSPVSCNGGGDGSIEMTLSGGSTPYTYDWNDNTLDGTEDPTGLTANTYAVTVTDDAGCSVTGNATVSQPSPIQLDCAEQSPVSAAGANDGVGSVTFSGGTSPFDYAWTGLASGNVVGANAGSYPIPNLPAGTYSLTLTDDNGCEMTCGFTITEPGCDLTLDDISATPVSCFGGMDGEISMTLSGGVQPFVYVWNDPDLNGLEDPTGLSAAEYFVTVTDAVGCEVAGNIIVGEPTEITLTCSEQSPVSASGANDGEGLVEFDGGTGPYNLNWSGGGSLSNLSAGSQVINNLSEGTYTVTLTDSNGCTETCSFTINGSGCALTLDEITPVDLTCFENMSGAIQLTLSGGVLPLDFVWNDPGLNGLEDPTGLAAGNYFVTVTDAIGCEVTGNTGVQEPTELMLSCENPAPVSMPGANDGGITLTFSGGTPAYGYEWIGPLSGNGNGASPVVLTDLPEGNYAVTLTDGNGCEMTCGFEITASMLGCSSELAEDSLEIRMIFDLLNGTGWTNQWNWSSPVSEWTAQTGWAEEIGLTPNQCRVERIRLDDNNLIGELADFDFPNLVYLNLSQNTLSGTMPDFTQMPLLEELFFSVNVLESPVPDFSQLTNLRKLHFHTNQVTGMLPNFSNLPNLNELSVFANEIDSLPPFTHFIDSAQPFQLIEIQDNRLTFDDILPNLSQINFTGNSGDFRYAPQAQVYVDTTITVNENDYLLIELDFDHAVSSNIYEWWKDGSLYATVNGVNDLEFTAVQLSDAGIYTVFVTNPEAPDLTLESYPIELVVLPDCAITSTVEVTDATCGEDNGEASAMPTGGSGTYTYLWNNGGTSQTITDLASGTYTVTINDGICDEINSGEVGFVPPPQVNLGADIQTCAFPVTLDAGAAVSHVWSTGETTQSIDVSSNGEYSVTTTDNLGCEAMDTILVESTGEINVSLDTMICEAESITIGTSVYSSPGIYADTLTAVGGCDSIITTNLMVETFDVFLGEDIDTCNLPVTLDAGSASAYLWSTGETTQTIDVSAADDYSVTITSATGCEAVDTVTVDISTAVSSEQDIVICDGQTFAVGDSTYSQTGVYQNIFPTQNGCDSIVTTTLEVTQLMADLGPDTTLCEGEILTLDATVSGCAACTYLWENGSTNPVRSVSPTATTAYSVTVTSGDCETSDEIVVNVLSVPPAPSFIGVNTACQNTSEVFTIQDFNSNWDYTLTIPGGSSFENTDEFVTVNFGTAASGQICMVSTNGCGDSQPTCQPITVNPSLVGISPNLSGNQTPCAIDGEEYCVEAIDGADTYQWQTPVGLFTSTEPCVELDWTASAGGEICVNAVGACDNSQTTCFEVTVQPSPTAAINGALEICEGESASLAINFTGTPPWDFSYQTGSGNMDVFGVTENPYLLNVTPPQSEVYSLINVSDANCDGTVSGTATVEVFEASEVDFSEEICAGEEYEFYGEILTEPGIYTHTIQSVVGCDSIVATLSLSVLPAANESTEANICEGESLPFGGVDLTETGIYCDTLTSLLTGCDSVVCLNLAVTPPESLMAVPDSAFIEATEDEVSINLIQNDIQPASGWALNVLNEPNEGTLEMLSNGTYRYLLSDPDYFGTDEFTYELCQVVCTDNCEEATVTITVERDCFENAKDGIPNVFTPNGDGVNDVFHPLSVFQLEGCTNYEVDKAELAIITRSGDAVFSASPYTAWEGTNGPEGPSLPVGTYYYSLRLETREGEIEVKGAIQLLR